MRAHRTLVALAAAVLAGCGGPSTEPPKTETVTSTVANESASEPNTSPSPSAAPGTSVPSTGRTPDKTSSLDDVVAWVESAPEADKHAYQSATQTWETPPSTTPLGSGAAFASPSGKITCVALFDYDSRLTCQIDLQHPQPRPSGSAGGNWESGWVDYSGDSASLGSFHGDPGAFVVGFGPKLPYGQKIVFGKDSDRYVCRMDQTGLWCADKAKGSAILLNDDGVTPYGCLKAISHRYGEGLSYAC